MFTQMLYLQWKGARWGVFSLVVLCFGLPLLVLRLVASSPHYIDAGAMAVLSAAGELMPVFPVLAVVTGAALGLTSWSWDHQVKHIYPLALPLPRWQYALLKLGSGVTILLIPVFALLIGAVIAAAQMDLPDGLRAYPVTFAARFLLAALIVFAATFAMAAGTVRTTMIIWLGFLVLLIGGTIVVEYLENFLNRGLTSPVDLLYAALLYWPGPFHVFGGNWMLIDV